MSWNLEEQTSPIDFLRKTLAFTRELCSLAEGSVQEQLLEQGLMLHGGGESTDRKENGTKGKGNGAS